MEATDKQLRDEEIAVRILLDEFFAQVAHMPIKEQIKLLAEFQEFIEQQKQKSKAV